MALHRQKPLLAYYTTEGSFSLWDYETKTCVHTFNPSLLFEEKGKVLQVEFMDKFIIFLFQTKFILFNYLTCQFLTFPSKETLKFKRFFVLSSKYSLLLSTEDNNFFIYNILQKLTVKTFTVLFLLEHLVKTYTPFPSFKKRIHRTKSDLHLLQRRHHFRLDLRLKHSYI